MDLNERLPILAHNSVPGVDCCGCLIARPCEWPNHTELVCNECGTVLLSAHSTILWELIEMVPDRKRAVPNSRK